MSSSLLFDTSTTGAAASHGHEGPSASAQIILFLMMGLLFGGLIREINKKTSIPYTIMLFISGLLLAYFSNKFGFLEASIESIYKVDPSHILMIFLPTLIFTSGYNIDWHMFKRQFVQIFTLAIPCVIVNAFLIAFSIKVILGYTQEYYTWTSAFMFGAILSCTDSGAILAFLKQIGGPKKFTSLIQGESLINDGMCMVLLIVTSGVVKGEKSLNLIEMGSSFLQLTFGGIAVGILAGIVAVYAIKKMFTDDVMIVNITFVACYLIYFLAENFTYGVSGIVATITLSLFMTAFGKARMSSEGLHAVNTVWKYASFSAETIIFLISGTILGTRFLIKKYSGDSLPILPVDFVRLIGLYICMMFSRYFSIRIFMPILERHGYGISLSEVFILSYSGLKGAVSICFALIIVRDATYDATLRHFLMFDMTGCVFLSILINGTTMRYFVRRTQLVNVDVIKQKVYLSNVQQLMKNIEGYKKEALIQAELSAVDWSKIDKYVGMPNYKQIVNKTSKEIEAMEKQQIEERFPSEGLLQKARNSFFETKEVKSDNEQELLPKDEEGRFSMNMSLSEISENEDDLEDRLITECRNKFLKAMRGEYYRLFRNNQCVPEAFTVLKEAVNWDLDNVAEPMSSWDFVSNYFINPTTIKVLFFLKRLPFVGEMARQNLFNHIFFVYDVVLNYLNAHDEIEKIASSFPFSEDIISTVISESEENKAMAESYFNNYLNISFPEVNQSIQIKRAATAMLNYQKSRIQNHYKQAQIEDKEYKVLMTNIENSLAELAENYGSWDLPPLKEFLKKIPFFSFFSESQLEEIIADSKEKPFQKDDFIIREGEKAQYIYLLTRGVATESCKSSYKRFKERLEIGSVISYHQIISGHHRYQTSCVADCLVYALRISLNKIKKMMKGNKKLNEFLWRESFYFFTRFYVQELYMFASTEPDHLVQVVNTFALKKYKPKSRVNISSGGIFLKGQAKEQTGDPNAKDKSEKIHQTLAYIAPARPGTAKYLQIDKCSWIFHFTNFERMTDLITYDAAEKDQSRSRSFFGYKDQAYPKKSIGPGTHLKVTVHKSTFEKEAAEKKGGEDGLHIVVPKSQESSALLKQKKQKSNVSDE